MSNDGYTVYEPGATPPPTGGTGGTWQVAVEYANDGQQSPPTELELLGLMFATREEALKDARRVAFQFDPPDPLMPQERRVYADGDGFVSIIRGMTMTFHFTTRVLQRLDP